MAAEAPAAAAAAAAAAVAISSPRPPHPSAITRSLSTLRFSSRPFAISSRLYSSRSNGSLEDHSSSSSSGDDKKQEDSNGGGNSIHHALPSPTSSNSLKNFAPVFVTLPIDVVNSKGKVTRRRAIAASLGALAAAGVEGVAVELWWGLVEREAPGSYEWDAYLDLMALAAGYGLKVRAVMAFHSSGAGPNDAFWIPLPRWVLEEMDRDPDLAYSDKVGRRNYEYLSLGCDALPVLKGRSPIQAYSDFMRSFRDTFRDFFGAIITEIQVGMGPAGELRYPSIPSEKLKKPGAAPELGEFQCYDKYMLSSLRACAKRVGMEPWGNGGPFGANSPSYDPEEMSFFNSDGSWNTRYGRFFLEWYSGALLLHGERLCSVAEAIFLCTGVKISAKVAAIHWHCYTCSHPSELTAGYYNTLTRDGYLSIARMLSQYRMGMCCTCFDKRDSEELNDSRSRPEGSLRQLVNAARICNLPLCGENSMNRLDEASLKQVIKSSRLYYSDGARGPGLSFNYVRMDRNFFEARNWNRFARFVRQMSDARTFQARLRCRSEPCLSCCTSASEELGRVFACH